ncbi:MAG: YtxH domain-containing protein [Flavobacterium sp.]
MESGKVLLGVLGGVAAGALLGVLFAPDRGSETRKKIKEKGKGYADNLKGKIDEIKHDVNGKYESFIGEAKDMIAKKEV